MVEHCSDFVRGEVLCFVRYDHVIGLCELLACKSHGEVIPIDFPPLRLPRVVWPDDLVEQALAQWSIDARRSAALLADTVDVVVQVFWHKASNGIRHFVSEEPRPQWDRRSEAPKLRGGRVHHRRIRKKTA